MPLWSFVGCPKRSFGDLKTSWVAGDFLDKVTQLYYISMPPLIDIITTFVEVMKHLKEQRGSNSQKWHSFLRWNQFGPQYFATECILWRPFVWRDDVLLFAGLDWGGCLAAYTGLPQKWFRYSKHFKTRAGDFVFFVADGLGADLRLATKLRSKAQMVSVLKIQCHSLKKESTLHRSPPQKTTHEMLSGVRRWEQRPDKLSWNLGDPPRH